MGWPYEFTTPTDEEKQLRRSALDHYAAVAHCSAFAPALAYLLARLVVHVRGRRRRRGRYQEVPNSPALKALRVSWAAALAKRGRMVMWWMGDDLYFAGGHWGQRDEWIFGVAWMGWLLALCVVGTGKDYLHLIKRFGIIAASQMPIQYLLALKYLNPFAYVFRSSHEEINRFHRVLGRIIYALLLLHALFYNVFFIESGIWTTRFFAPVVFAGVLALLGFHALSGTAVARVRAYSYRLFFITHLVSAMAIPPLIYYHAQSARTYVLTALVVFVFDLAVRKMRTVTAPTTVEAIPGTNLLKISAKLHEATIGKYRAHPGSHIYMSIPPASRPVAPLLSISGYLYEFLYNPFTVASVSEQGNELTMVARARSGPLTKRLAHFAANPSSDNQISLGIEGPYGAVGKTFSELVRPGIDRILLIAGGVGATFALPIYHAILEERPISRVQLIWAIRSPGDATWATSGANGKSVIDDDGVHLFLTGDMNLSESTEGVELSTLDETKPELVPNKRRPDFQNIIDDAFRHGAQETVAVLVCGPAEMARDVRRRVSPWVYEGRKVWWHNESFGW